jgi:hypothetical protein
MYFVLRRKRKFAEEETGDPGDVGRVADLGLLAAVTGRDRDVPDGHVVDVQPDQEVVAVAVALVDAVEGELGEALVEIAV